MSEEMTAVTGAPAAAPATEVSVVVSSRVREVVKAKGLRSDGKLAEALNAKVLAILDRACERAKAESRATVRPADLAEGQLP